MPKEIQPGQDLIVKYHTKMPGKIAIFAVDEGILDLLHNPNNLVPNYINQRLN